MKILMLAEVSACTIGGGSHRMLREQAAVLKKRGHDVCLLVREPSDDHAPQASFEGVTEYRYKVNRTSAPAFVISSVIGSIRMFDQIEKNGFHPDVVLIDQSLAGLGPIFFRKGRCASWIYQSFSLAHEEYLTRNIPGKGLFAHLVYYAHVQSRLWIERWTIGMADRVIIMSKFMKQQLITSHMTPEYRIYTLPGAADTSRFKPPADKRKARATIRLADSRTLLFTARNLVPRMGLENLIKAIAELGSQCDDTLLIIAGTGPLRPSLEQLVKSLNLTDKITLTGYLPDDLLPTYYQAADLVLMPTLALEGFGMVTVEALACGTPVLGTPIGATPEILGPIDKRLLTKGPDSHALAESLGQILQIIRNNPAEWLRVGKRCLDSVKELYNWDNHGRQLEAIFLDQIKQNQ